MKQLYGNEKIYRIKKSDHESELTFMTRVANEILTMNAKITGMWIEEDLATIRYRNKIQVERIK